MVPLELQVPFSRILKMMLKTLKMVKFSRNLEQR